MTCPVSFTFVRQPSVKLFKILARRSSALQRQAAAASTTAAGAAGASGAALAGMGTLAPAAPAISVAAASAGPGRLEAVGFTL